MVVLGVGGDVELSAGARIACTSRRGTSSMLRMSWIAE